ncbi:hypothetical protein D3C71_1057180 [compost metagenome]
MLISCSIFRRLTFFLLILTLCAIVLAWTPIIPKSSSDDKEIFISALVNIRDTDFSPVLCSSVGTAQKKSPTSFLVKK